MAVVAPTAAKDLGQEIAQQSRHQLYYKAVGKYLTARLERQSLTAQEE